MLRASLSWLGLFVSAAFAYLAVRHVHYAEVWKGLRSCNFWWLVPAFLMLAVTVMVRAIRWRYMFRPATRPPMRPVVVALLTSYFFNNTLPARAGEAARVVVLKRRARASIAETAATVIVERVFDVACLLALLFIALPWLPRETWLHDAVLLTAGLLVAIVVTVVVLAIFGARPLQIALRPLEALPFFSRYRFDLIAENVTHGLASLRSPRIALGALFWTTLGWLTLAVSTWLVMLGFSAHISVVGGLLVVIATNLAMVLPSSPSAIGVFEAAVVLALRPYGLSSSGALSYALVLHALNFIPFVLLGPFLVRDAMSVRRISEAS